MLEFNLYSNFNPNKASDFTVKARGVAMNYELWQTGYKYTSTATLSISAEVGDVVEILIDDNYSLAINSSKVENYNLNLLYVVTDINSDNKATFKNSFCAMIDGVQVPTKILSGSSLSILNLITNPKTTALINKAL